MRLIVINHITLDGVMQGPGRPDEDDRGGFGHGGWSDRSADPAMGAAMGERMGEDFSWLFGRRTYDDLLSHWNEVGGPFKDGLNGATKYVASADPDTDLPWPNSTLLTGDVPAAVSGLREQPGGNLVVLGSGALVRSLVPHRLVDEWLLFVHPLVIGSGQRLFGAGDDPYPLRLVDSTTTDSGVIVATYRPTDGTT